MILRTAIYLSVLALSLTGCSSSKSLAQKQLEEKKPSLGFIELSHEQCQKNIEAFTHKSENLEISYACTGGGYVEMVGKVTVQDWYTPDEKKMKVYEFVEKVVSGKFCAADGPNVVIMINDQAGNRLDRIKHNPKNSYCWSYTNEIKSLKKKIEAQRLKDIEDALSASQVEQCRMSSAQTNVEKEQTPFGYRVSGVSCYEKSIWMEFRIDHPELKEIQFNDFLRNRAISLLDPKKDGLKALCKKKASKSYLEQLKSVGIKKVLSRIVVSSSGGVLRETEISIDECIAEVLDKK